MHNLKYLIFQVLLWDMTNYKLLKRLVGHYNDVLSASFSPDNAMLATASCDSRIIIWDVVTGKNILKVPYNLSNKYYVALRKSSKIVIL